MVLAVSAAMACKLDWSSCFAETSLYSAWSTVSRSPSSVRGAPVVILMVRMSGSEAFDGAGLVGVHLDEVLRAGHREHRLDAFLDAGELQRAARRVRLPVEIHEAADRRAVDVADRRQIDDDLALAGGDEFLHRGGELRKKRIHEAGLAYADDRDAAVVFGRDVHQ